MTQSATWSGKTALVTGGSTGLGFAIADALAAAGANVAITARGADRLADAAARLARHGAGVHHIVADVTTDAQAEHAVNETIARFGKLDVLVNNVGRSARGELLAVELEVLRDLIDVNVITTARCTRLAAPHLIASRGHIVNIGSLAAKSAAKWLGGYPAAKFALAGYTQQLRLELAPQGVHVLLVCPGPIASRDGPRHVDQVTGLPESASRPGGGVHLKGLDPEKLARRILRACEKRQPEIVIPGKARLLVAISALFPKLGDWLVERWTR